MTKEELFQQWWHNTEPIPFSGCWVWLGSQNGYHYRKAYEMLVGSLKPGHDIHHKCKVRGCWNPDHLAQLTELEHVRMHRDAISPVSIKVIGSYNDPIFHTDKLTMDNVCGTLFQNHKEAS